MPNFKNRSTQLELLDADNIKTKDLYRNLHELEVINRLLGGHSATIKGLRKLIPKNKTVSIADFGCGGGDTLRHIYKWANKNHIEVQLIGYDLLPDAVDFAKLNTPEEWGIIYKTANFHNIPNDEKFDIVISSLFTHHLYNGDLQAVLKKKFEQSRIGFIVNDLHRHPLAYYSIKWLTQVLSKSHLVKNDAPLSVEKGFKKREWKTLMKANGIEKFSVQWVWAFRHLVIGYKQ